MARKKKQKRKNGSKYIRKMLKRIHNKTKRELNILDVKFIHKLFN